MEPLMIEVSFDDGEQVVPSGIPGWVASLLHEFGFQSAEATFRRCVDPSNFPSGSWIDLSPPHQGCSTLFAEGHRKYGFEDRRERRRSGLAGWCRID